MGKKGKKPDIVHTQSRGGGSGEQTPPDRVILLQRLLALKMLLEHPHMTHIWILQHVERTSELTKVSLFISGRR